ncbi:hypothetical protein [Amycolatopsis sp. VC5-11]|uniref:hypothetical protein n=1 Tax=Amycolatopsis sp. VC5-11 TaxID=3120156 RepID=UPI0030096793
MTALAWFAVVAPPACTALGMIVGRRFPSMAVLRRHDAAVLVEFDKQLADRARRILNDRS